MKLQFSAAREEDIPVIFTQAKNLIDQYEDVSNIAYDKVLAWVMRKIEANILEYCCVMADGEKSAYYRLCEDGELDDLYVLPAFQNRGIGSAIMSRCIAKAENNIYLYVFSRNSRAISFYERFGFSMRETVGKTRLIMERKG